MPHTPIETTVIGSYPFPGWLELCSARTAEMGPDDVEEAARDATLVAVMDQVRAGLDVISDGEQGRFDFNLSFYAYLEGSSWSRRRAGGGGRRRTTSAASTGWSASWPLRAGSAPSRSSSGCARWRRPARR